MEPDLKQELRQLGYRVSGMSSAMETGFEGLRKDVYYLSRTNIPVLALAVLAPAVSVCAIYVALDNRALILTVSAQTAKNTGDLENIRSVVFQPYTPTPYAQETESEPEK